jgi:hypothetical protein
MVEQIETKERVPAHYLQNVLSIDFNIFQNSTIVQWYSEDVDLLLPKICLAFFLPKVSLLPFTAFFPVLAFSSSTFLRFFSFTFFFSSSVFLGFHISPIFPSVILSSV